MNMTTVPSDQLKAMQHQLAAQELVIQQLRDALEFCSGTSYIDDAHRIADEALTIPTSTEHLEAWYKEMVGEPIAIVDDAGVLIVCNYSYKQGDKLHAIKPFKGGG